VGDEWLVLRSSTGALPAKIDQKSGVYCHSSSHLLRNVQSAGGLSIWGWRAIRNDCDLRRARSGEGAKRYAIRPRSERKGSSLDRERVLTHTKKRECGDLALTLLIKRLVERV
jgi:hypothetical protein